jgi:hypothetical protein
MQSGLLNLKALYTFVRKHRAEAIQAMRIDRSSPLGDTYSRACKDLVAKVPQQQGLYLWGFYNHNGFWTNLYVGKAALRKTASLRNRLFEELTKERACIWREVLSIEELEKIGEQIHPQMWTKNVHHWHRALEKAGTTHIAWVALPNMRDSSIEPIENDLIESMNPTGNRKRTQPPEQFRDDTNRVFGQFREIVNVKANRKTSFLLEYHRDFWKKLG